MKRSPCRIYTDVPNCLFRLQCARTQELTVPAPHQPGAVGERHGNASHRERTARHLWSQRVLHQRRGHRNRRPECPHGLRHKAWRAGTLAVQRSYTRRSSRRHLARVRPQRLGSFQNAGTRGDKPGALGKLGCSLSTCPPESLCGGKFCGRDFCKRFIADASDAEITRGGNYLRPITRWDRIPLLHLPGVHVRQIHGVSERDYAAKRLNDIGE